MALEGIAFEVFELMLSVVDSFSVPPPATRRVRRHPSLHSYQIPDPHKVVSRYGKLEYPSDLGNSPVAKLAQQTYCFQPPKYFFYSLTFPLADSISAVVRLSIADFLRVSFCAT